MSDKNKIVLATEPQGVFLEGTIVGTPLPGTVMEIVPATEPVNGRFSWRVATPGADGARMPIVVLMADSPQGKTVSDAYVTGTRGFLYAPAMGETLNMLVADASGTGDTHAIGDLFIVDNTTGKLIATTGSPESEPFKCTETTTNVLTDELLECQYTGY